MNKKKYFVFSDIHGCYYELIEELKNKEYDQNNPDHILLFLGDAFDKESDNREDYKLFTFLRDNIKNNKLIWIRGNHDEYLLKSLINNKASKFTEKTIRNIAKGLNDNIEVPLIDDCIKLLINNKVNELIMNNTLYYYETKHFVFTHGMIPFNKKDNTYNPNWRTCSNNTWKYFMVHNGMKYVLSGIKIPDKTLVCGHVGAYYGNITKMYPDLLIDSKEFNSIGNKLKKNSKLDTEPFKTFYGDGVIGLDAKTYDTGMVNVLVIEDVL